VVLPLSAWLSRVFGPKNYYMACVALFSVSSLMCGLAPSLGLLIFFRVLQGIGGGGLAPVEQAILVEASFQPSNFNEKDWHVCKKNCTLYPDFHCARAPRGLWRR
jgi:MFS family permease